MAIGDGQVMDRVRSFLLEPTFANQEGMKPEDVARRRAMAEALWSQGHSTQPVVGVFDGMNRVLQSFLGGRQLRQAEAADQSIRARDEADQVAGLNAMADFAFPNQTSGGVPGASQGWPATGTQQTGLTPVAGDGDFTGTAWRPGQPAGALTPDGVASAGGGNYRDAISGIESGGDYSLLGPVANASGDRAYGRYQVMGENVGPWTEQVLGRRMTPQEFLADPAAQDAVFDSIFGGYVQRYGPEGAARAWFTGSPTGTGTDVLGTTADHYVEMFRNGGGTAITAASATGTATTANPTRAFVDSLIANPATRPYAAQILQDQITVLMTPPAPADPFTLNEGDVRYDGQGNPIAANTGTQERPLTAEERVQWGIPADTNQVWVMGADGPEARGSGGGVNVNIPGQPTIGTVPAGYAAIQDPQTGQWRYEAIPGGPVANAADAARAGELTAGNIVLQDIDRALGQAGTWTTGFLGNLTRGVPGTPGYDLARTVDTIRANVGFGQLQQMRQSSPTGAGLGNVTEQENRLLQSVLGNLETSQSQEQFRQNLERLKSVYLDIVHGPGNWSIGADGQVQVGGAGAAPAAAPAAGGVQEGATATNPTTGERIIYRGGQWVPM